MFVGAEIDCEDKSRNTALHIAARYGHELIITALIKHGANTTQLVYLFCIVRLCFSDTKQLEGWGWVLFVYGSLKGKTIFTPSLCLSRVMTCLFSLSFFPSRRGVHGMFPLHLAALNGFSDCCRKLLSSGTFMLTPFKLDDK